jgi:alanyl-tRNA synthetase
MEFWNLVFTQFNKEEDGGYSDLPKPNIDTGMGLERMASVMQDTDGIFDVDTIAAIRDKVCEIAGIEYNFDAGKDVSVRIITDHARSITFMVSDGILPANEGRGYVLKRLLRRAARHGKLLGIDKPFLTDVCRVVADVSKGAYAELIEKQDYIYKVISLEENRFHETLDQGIDILRQYIDEMSGSVLSGAAAFKLYDTFGFPPELVEEILEEHGLTYDKEAFSREMDAQKQRARAAREESTYMGSEATVYDAIESDSTTTFVGYTETAADSAIIALVANGKLADRAREGDDVSVLLDVTPFYAESGGQAGDRGVITAPGGKIDVSGCLKTAGGRFAHIGVVTEGEISLSDTVHAKIDKKSRAATARNHSATHLLHKALRLALGTHVEQAGSHVTGERLRFDFSHFQPVSKAELTRVESEVNEKILEGLNVGTEEMPVAQARKEGATALFGEKYGSVVRVVSIGGDYSKELCGGTHIGNTANIGSFKIVAESGVAAGVRRIEALTGEGALLRYRENDERLNEVAAALKTSPENVGRQIAAALANARELSKELERLKSKLSGSLAGELIAKKETIAGISVVLARVDDTDANALRGLGDEIKCKLASGAVILIGGAEGKLTMLVTATDDIVKAGFNAGTIVKEAVAELGGKGGGRPNTAMAGGKDANKTPDAFKTAKTVIERLMTK